MSFDDFSRRTGGRGSNEDFIREFRDQYNKFMNNFKKGGSFLLIGIVAVVLLIGVLSSFYTVQPKEEAVVLRFGKYLETNPPGLHFKIPFGVDSVYKLPTRLVLQEEFGFRTRGSAGRHSTYDKGRYDKESIMLTGDLNVADVEWVVQFRISDPNKFLFNVRDPSRNIRDVSESVMRRVVGDRLVSEILTTGRVEIAGDAKKLMQEILDKYDFGINVVSVKLQDVNPPELVKPSFNDVNSAKQEQEQLINQAEKEYNKVIPEARGKAEETIAKAEGFSEALINRARGDASKFSAMASEYARAPSVTKKRIYLETLEGLFAKFEKLTIVDSKVKGLLPIFSKGNVDPAKMSGIDKRGAE